MFAFATLVPMLAFGYLAYTYAVSQTLDQANIRLREESKTYALILLERLQTYRGIDAYDIEPLAERPKLSLDRDNDRIIIGRSRPVLVDIWLRDLDASTFQRCLIIDGIAYRCSDNLPANTETLGQTWQLFLEGNFTKTFDLSVRTTTTKQQVLQTLSPLEQLYPLQPEDMKKVLEPYRAKTPIYWVQEEPENMGAWRRMKGKFGTVLNGSMPLTSVCRAASASPATGSAHSHRVEQRELIDAAFGDGRTSWY